MKSKPLMVVLAGGLLIAAAAGGWWWRQAGQRRDAVVATLPAAPDLSAALEPLRERIAAAEQQARSLLHSQAGLIELSQLYHANGFLEESVRCYEGLERLQPGEPRWLHRHATILAGFGEIEAALPLWQRVVKLAPDYVPAWLRIGDCELKANRLQQAAATYAAVRARSPDDPYALLGLARVDYENARWEPAREKLETLVQQTNFQLGYDLIVSVYEKLGQHDRALAIRGAMKASGAYRDPPDPWIDVLLDHCYDPYRLSLAAGVFARSGDPARALQLLQRAVELAPNDISSRFQLATLYVDQREIAAGREQLERCTQMAPEFSDGWARLSALQAQLGDAAAAERTLAAGLANCPNSPGLHLMRARSLRQAGRSPEAINDFMISIRLRPNEPEAYVELGTLYIELGRVDEGVAQIRAALEAEPADPMALSVLAFHAITTGNEPEARQWMQRVARQPRVTNEYAQRLRDAYVKQFGHEPAP